LMMTNADSVKDLRPSSDYEFAAQLAKTVY